jgi:hypothetical protein
VFDALLDERDPGRVARLLRVFTRTGPPAFDERLLAWASALNEDVSDLAVRVLSYVTHERIHQHHTSRVRSPPQRSPSSDS